MGTSRTGYAQAYLATDAPCSVDAVTVNPYLGPASLEPFMVEAERAGRGVIVLVRNSNTDSSTYQSVDTSAGPFFKVVAASLAGFHERLARGTTGWSSLGVTVAATYAEDTEQIRVVLPRNTPSRVEARRRITAKSLAQSFLQL